MVVAVSGSCRHAVMDGLDELRISLKEFAEGTTEIGCTLGDTFLKTIDVREVRGGDVSLHVGVSRTGNVFVLNFTARGTVVVPCDRCLDDVEQPIEASDSMVVRLSENEHHCAVDASDEADDAGEVVIDCREGTYDASCFVSGLVALAIPPRCVHPEGGCSAAMSRLVDEYTGGGGAHTTDPRWKELEKLI